MEDTKKSKERKSGSEFNSFYDPEIKLKPFYSSEDIKDFDYGKDLGDPGQYPFTRGIYPDGHRNRPWRRMQYAGYGSGEDTNTRWKYLISYGQKGLNLPLDFPTQLGLDSDDPRAEGEVGRVGVAIDTIDDMERMYEGIDIGEISSAYTINATANILLAMYIGLAKKRGVPLRNLRGTMQNDIIKEYLARGLYIYPIRSAIKMIGDTIEYCLKHMPQFNPVNISPHYMYAGATQVQGWAVMFLTAITYIEEVMKRGFTYDEVAQIIPFGHCMDMDLLSNLALIRAVRRHWARIGKIKFGAKDKRSMMMRLAIGIFGHRLIDRQPLNNLCRITLMALAGALGGGNSMHLASYDEAYAIPTEEATRLSLMIQNILIEETNICSVVDPFGGSYLIERLTNEFEQEIEKVMEDIKNQGGIVDVVERGVLHRQWANQAFQEEAEIQTGRRIVVGLNKYEVEEDRRKYEAQMFEIDPMVEKRQIDHLRKVKATRDRKAVEQTLDELKRAAEREENLMPYLISCAENFATVGEMSKALRQVYGEYREANII